MRYEIFEMIDSHQHFWQVGRFDYPWMGAHNSVLYRDYLPEQLKPILAANGVEKTVLVQASNSVEESRWLLELTEEHSFIAGVVGWVDLMSDEVEQQLDELAAHPKFKGVRHLVESEPDDEWLLQPKVINGLNRLSENGLSYDLLVHTRHLKQIPALVEQCPELSLVIDHMAKPQIAKSEFEEWYGALKIVAGNPSIYCKLSGLVTEANWENWQTSDLTPYVEAALELFGPGRMMFGSDHPVCLLASSYERVLESFREILGSLHDDDKERIFATNAQEFYRLN